MKKFDNLARLFSVLLLLLLAPAESDAQPADPDASNDVAQQMALDVTPIPTGKGALFFPRLATSGTESPVVIEYEGRRVATSRTGRRIALPPGNYEAFVGSGPQELRASKDVRVVDGVTTPVEAFYGGLSLHAVDSEGDPIEVAYQIRQLGALVSDSQTTTDGVPNATLLRPRQALVKLEDGTELTVEIVAGKHLEYRIVFDGPGFARMLPLDSDFAPRDKWWRARWTVGANASFSDTSDQISNFNGSYLQVGVFSDTELGVDYLNHLALLKMGIDQSWVGVSTDVGADVPTRKLIDEVDAELIYNYRLARIFGPYVRAKLHTSLFETNYYAAEDTTLELDGSDVGTVLADTNRRLMDPFSPLYLQETAGLSLTLVDTDVVSLITRAGGGFRQHYFADGLFVEGQNGDVVTLTRLENEDFVGLAGGAVAGLRLSQAVRLEADADIFVPSGQVTGDDDFEALFEFNGLAEFAINNFASVVYRASIASRTNQTPVSVYQGLSFRLQHNLF